METAIDELSVATDRDVSLIRGGPFYRAQKAIKLIDPNAWNQVRRLLLAIMLGWLPLILITALSHPDGLVSLLRDYRVHCRMLIAVPVLIIGELLMESHFRMVVSHIRKAGLLETQDCARLDDIIRMVLRLRDSLLPEFTILFLLIVHTAISFKSRVDATPWLMHASGSELHLTLAGWYAALVSATLFQFLLGLALWKWLLWALFAFRVSRLKLKLVPTHPDGHGGLGFLGLTPVAFTPIAFAATVVIAGTWRHEILHHGANLMSFKVPAITLVVIIALLALGPLLIFAPRLLALRRQGILEYGVLAQAQVSAFHDKWIHQNNGHESEFLLAPESRALASFAQSYQRLQQMNPFLADKGTLISLAGSVVVPMLPLVLSVVPIATILKILLKALH